VKTGTNSDQSPASPFQWRNIYPLVFGLFLGLALLKFGNPVILDFKVTPPETFDEFVRESWPVRWGYPLLGLLLITGLPIALKTFSQRLNGQHRGLVALPALWFLWQAVAETQSVDPELTRAALYHFLGCVGCWFAGYFVLSSTAWRRWLWAGVFAGLSICLIRGANQKLVDFKHDHDALVEGERCGWTNFPPEAVVQMKRDSMILTTNGIDIANPMILLKLSRQRVNGTLVYPNALAGALLLLLPTALLFALTRTGQLMPVTRILVGGVTLFLGIGCFFWTGSKSAWLIGLGQIGFWLIQFRWPRRAKIWVVGAIFLVGLAAFGIRFQGYFQSGATSVGARMDYWKAAIQTAAAEPVHGTGPGSFMRPYARLKAPESEMTRLVHNDYLEQFSDSGIPGGVLYLMWIGLAARTIARRAKTNFEPVYYTVALGVLGWFCQGFVEFGLYIPALAWSALALAGTLCGMPVDVPTSSSTKRP